MSKFLVVVFNSESDAYEGKKALFQLNKEGDIVIFASAVIIKDSKGHVSIKHADDEGPIGTSIGLLVGAMTGIIAAGALAAPAAIVAGTSIGGLSGMFLDLHKSGIDVDFLDQVSTQLHSSGAALIVDIAETWITPVNEELKKHGAIVFRQDRSEIIEDNLLRKIESSKSKIKELKEELADSASEFKESIKKSINSTKSRIKETEQVIQNQLASTKEEVTAKIDELKKRAVDANTENKKKYDKQIEKLKKNLDLRSKKLQQALHLAKEALS